MFFCVSLGLIGCGLAAGAVHRRRRQLQVLSRAAQAAGRDVGRRRGRGAGEPQQQARTRSDTHRYAPTRHLDADVDANADATAAITAAAAATAATAAADGRQEIVATSETGTDVPRKRSGQVTP